MEINEAIEIVREYYPSSGKDLNEALETLIPELKESEDERVRKALIRGIKSVCKEEEVFTEGFTRKQIVSWLEKQGSQNLAKSEKTCKDEPKFEVGDWVVYNGDICQIVKREEGCNKLVTNFGIEKELVNERNLSTARLWTIQDAKDGDILCTYECDNPKIVFILKGTPKKHYALSYHCYYNVMYPHFEFDSESGCLAPNDEDVKPATKEQRDILFQKMKEAGYEWDAEKKELKKIEQNPDWSEEDSPYYDDICEILINLLHSETTNVNKDAVQKDLDWFNTLKERYTWKPSDKQMIEFERACGGRLLFEQDIILSLYNDLKKLKG